MLAISPQTGGAPTFPMHAPKDLLSQPPLPIPLAAAAPASPATILPPRQPMDPTPPVFRRTAAGGFLCLVCQKTWPRFSGFFMHLSVSISLFFW